MEEGSIADIYVLPEGCISKIISLTSPRDACRLSVISSFFRSAADSDYVWERFLPSDYRQILSSSSASPSPLSVFSSKKELYLHLCQHPLLIDGDTKSFALEKCSGKKCYMIGARALSIVWEDTLTYWRWRPLPESRFSEVAELLNGCWLEIHGKMETRLLSPNTTYVAFLVYKLNELPDFELVEVSVKLVNSGGGGSGEEMIKSVNLIPVGIQRRQVGWRFRGLRPWDVWVAVEDPRLQQEGQIQPKEREDGWMDGDRDG